MASCAVTPAAADAGDLQRRWAETVKKIAAVQPSRGGLLQSSRAVRDDGATLTVAFPKGSNFALKMISRPDSNALVMPVICEVFGKRSVEYVMDGAAAAAPAPVAPTASASQVPANPTPQAARVPQTAPAPQSVPTPQTAPAPRAPAVSDAAPSAVPSAPAPAPQAAPAAQAALEPAIPTADQATGPTVLAERDLDADRKAWEDDMPPYDDAFVASYEDDFDAAPIEVPGDAPSAAGMPVEPRPSSPAASAPDASPETPDVPTAPVVSDAMPPSQGTAVNPGGEVSVDPKAVLQNIWGNVVFK